MKEETRNSKLLAEFTAYCAEHKELRFWQALRSWSGAIKIMYGKWDKDVEDEVFTDTFYWEEKDR